MIGNMAEIHITSYLSRSSFVTWIDLKFLLCIWLYLEKFMSKFKEQIKKAKEI